MTDEELVKRLRNRTRDSIMKENDRMEAANRIEALITERDANDKNYCTLMERYDALQVNNSQLRDKLKENMA